MTSLWFPRETFPTFSLTDFDSFFEDFIPLRSRDKFPLCEEKYDEKGATFQLALAGYPESSLEIQATEEKLVVTGKKVESEENLVASRAFTWGRTDPGGVFDFLKADINYQNGLLTLKVPKKELKQPKLLPIKTK